MIILNTHLRSSKADGPIRTPIETGKTICTMNKAELKKKNCILTILMRTLYSLYTRIETQKLITQPSKNFVPHKLLPRNQPSILTIEKNISLPKAQKTH